MRWRFVDKIDSFQPWRSAAGRKAVSLEEYSLGEPFGRKGVLPESLVLESCVQLVRWLVARSSEFRSTCILSEIDGFSLLREVGMGDVLAVAAEVVGGEGEAPAEPLAGDRLRAECRVRSGGELVARGALSFGLLPMAAVADPEATEAIWRELYGAS